MNKFNDSNFNEEIASGITVVDFYADWCGPCKMLAPVLEQFAGETDVKVGKLDVDSEIATATKYQVMTIPTVIVFKDGQPVATKVGFMSKDALHDLVNSVK